MVPLKIKESLRENLKSLRTEWLESLKVNREEFRLRIKEIRNEFENDREDILDSNDGDEWIWFNLIFQINNNSHPHRLWLVRVFVSPARLAKFKLSLNRVIDIASVTTGWRDPQGVMLAFFVCNRSPSVCTKAGGVFAYWWYFFSLKHLRDW